MLNGLKLTNRDDIRFIFYEERRIHNQIKSLMESYSGKAQAYMTRLDRLCLVECFREPEIKEAYPKTQDVMIWAKLDGWNSYCAKQGDFYTLIADKFNDPTYDPKTPALPDLHGDDYSEGTYSFKALQ